MKYTGSVVTYLIFEFLIPFPACYTMPSIDVGDGEAHGHAPPPKKKRKSGRIFSSNISYKFRAFC